MTNQPDKTVEEMVSMTTTEFEEVCRNAKADGVIRGLKRAEFAIKEELKEVKRKPVAKTFG